MTAENGKQIVNAGYDKIAKEYLEWTSRKTTPRVSQTQRLLALLPKDAMVLELGCGAGTPCTQMISQHVRKVTGVDISEPQIRLARANAPGVDLVQADMMDLSFPPKTFDAVTAFYAIIHLQRDDQVVLLKRIASWLTEGGYLLLNTGTQDCPEEVKQDWLGVPMYWSGYDGEKYHNIMIQIGFEIVYEDVISENEDGQDVPFLWFLLRKKGNK